MGEKLVPDSSEIGRTALLVKDLDNVTEFYQKKVGLKLLEQTRGKSVLGSGDTPLLVLGQDEGLSQRERTEAGLFHNAFKVPSRTALASALHRLQESGELRGASDHHVSEALYTSDPEGNGIEIYADRPKQEWPRTDRGYIKMGTEPLDFESLAAESGKTDGVPEDTTVGHVHLEVLSVEDSRAFYADELGLQVQASMPQALFFSMGDYHHHIGANTWNHRTQQAKGRGINWFEILVEEKALEKIRNNVEEYIELKDGASLQLTDPNGIEVRIRGT